jgi:hypothetical protein
MNLYKIEHAEGHLKKESLAIKERKGVSEMKNGFGEGGKNTPTMMVDNSFDFSFKGMTIRAPPPDRN